MGGAISRLKNGMDNCRKPATVATIMKTNLMTTILTWVLGTSMVLSIFFGYQFFSKTRQMPPLEMEIQTYQNNHAFLNALVGDIVEYSKRDPGIDPLLVEAGVKPGKIVPAAAKPSGK
jgi:hypothetical protein